MYMRRELSLELRPWFFNICVHLLEGTNQLVCWVVRFPSPVIYHTWKRVTMVDDGDKNVYKTQI